MNIDEILLLKYPAEMASGKIKCVEENDSKGVVISHWDMPIPQPSKDEILSYEIDVSFKKQINSLKEDARILIKELILSAAKQRNYDSAESCASYALSTVPQWREEAETFIAWRDAVYQTAIDAYNAIESGAQTPKINSFLDSLPKIIWP